MADRLDADGVTRELPAKVVLTPRLLAEVFTDMSDEAQAQFFIDVADLAKAWDGDQGLQWRLVGAHLRDCSCATEEARDMVRAIAYPIRTMETVAAGA